MAGEKRGFKTGDFVLCKWDVDTDDGGRENWLPVHLGKCSENNTGDVFWLTRKDNVLVSELIDGEPSMSNWVVESDLRKCKTWHSFTAGIVPVIITSNFFKVSAARKV